ncbi:MFS transporter [Roseococcus sp. SYP-B2431]|uniref:MFS transporter n=1 Tax=Roseococcus sp. SYP-B2431 TaxID=2496640 RepID=UPI00197E0293|nr:MFS transporter [Roseococcus sp. SYP-B2431]
MTAAPMSYRLLLAAAGLRPLLAATLLSRLASRMFMLTIVLYALGRFDSPAMAGWLGFAAMAPGLAVSPIAGALLDRMGPAWAVALDMAVSGALVLALVALDVAGLASAPLVIALVALYSLTSPLGTAGVRTLLPRLVPPGGLERANALDTSIHALVNVAGPALAGALVGLAGAHAALAVVGLTYAAAALCIGLVREPPRPPSASGPLLLQALQGVVRVLRQPTLRGLAVCYALYQMSWGILVVAVPVFATRNFSPSTADFVSGLLWACIGVAGGLGALLMGRVRMAGRERLFIAGGMLAAGLAICPVASFFGLAGLVLGLMAVGALAGPIDVGLLTLRQRRTDPAELGRVLSVSMSLNFAGFPIGTAVAGWLLSGSVTLAFVVAGLAAMLGAAMALAMIPAADDRDQYTSRR